MNPYSASDIKLLEGLDAVRMRPGMYIGSTGARGLHHMLWEIVDNAVDEAANGYADQIDITIFSDNSVSVKDNGRGIPVDINEQTGLTGVELVFTKLHAGGKFGDGNYSYSGGLHGVGSSVVNALSRWLRAEIHVGGYAYVQAFASEVDPQTGAIDSGKPIGTLQKKGRSTEHGSVISFLPDDRVFETLQWSHSSIAKRLRELAFLNQGVRFTLLDKRAENSQQEIFYAEGGLVDFVRYLNQDKTPVHTAPILIEGEKDGIRVHVAMQYNDGYTESIVSYVNNIPTTEGGTHEIGFKTALVKMLNEYCRKNNFLKEKDKNLEGSDYREGLTAVISLQMKNVQFEGQTKTKLGNTEARSAVEGVMGEQLSLYLQDLRHAEMVGKIVEKAIKAAKVREATRKAKNMARERSKLEGAPLVGKLASATGRDPQKNELFLVEGDSAGGSAKQGRDRHFQAILPLRGKPLNAEKKRLDQVLGNDEFRSIITALGTGIDEDFTLSSLRYDKVIILADADQDGAHIRAILLTFFFRYMKELINEGHVYIGMPPLYKVSRGKQDVYCYTDEELEKATKKAGKGYTVQRYKGLGEMNPEQLWDTTMNPEGRTLVQVQVDDAAEADRIVTILMGDKTEPRKLYIAENANFNKLDTFAQCEEVI